MTLRGSVHRVGRMMFCAIRRVRFNASDRLRDHKRDKVQHWFSISHRYVSIILMQQRRQRRGERPSHS
jgi:hypothetical protein